MTAAVTRIHRHHPEWCALAVAASGWSGLVALALVPAGGQGGHAPVLVHVAMMAAAMMAPLVLDQVNHVAVFSLWRRRYRAAACYLAGYLGAWTLVGAAMATAGAAAAAAVGGPLAVVAAFALTVAVTASPRRQYRIRQCWATRPLALRGWRADRDCLVSGLEMARRCVAASWALMLAVAVQPTILVMAAATALTLAERRGRLDHRQTLVVTVALAVGSLLETLLLGSHAHHHL